ncbi:MAG: esterase-like activity of phytase family protein [Sandaracinobacteroides sp.]
MKRIWTLLSSALSSAGALGIGAAAALYAAGPALGSGPVARLDVEAVGVPLSTADPALMQVGRLRYLGGLELKAADVRFGGLSGLVWEAGCKRLLAVSDSGTWVVLQPEESGDRLTGIAAAWIAPVMGPDGRPPISKRAADAEAIARLADGSSWVFYEQDHRAERFQSVSACNPTSLAKSPDRRWEPAGTEGWPGNGGMEAVAGEGRDFLILLEAVPGKSGRRMGLAGEPGPVLAAFSWEAPAGHDPTDMAALNPGTGDGRMLVLHRSFSPLSGVSVILSEGTIVREDGATSMPAELARLRPPLAVDNLEGIAVREDGQRRFIYMVSDDNFNALQRTLLLKFELLAEKARTE